MRGAPRGNQNAKGKGLWASAIRRAVAKRVRAIDGNATVDDGLEKCAEKLVDAAFEGEQWALLEMGNRIDGKAAQAITVAGDDDAPPVKWQGIIDLVRPGKP
jgi:hypothetical protein